MEQAPKIEPGRGKLVYDKKRKVIVSQISETDLGRLMLYAEYGFRAHEKGKNLEAMRADLRKLLTGTK